MNTKDIFLIFTGLISSPIFFSLFLISGCAQSNKQMTLFSSAFSHEELIPPLYTCDGEDISPPLSWSNAPENTKSFALICEDPDAPMGTWIHWIIFNIPANYTQLPSNIPKTQQWQEGILQGKNSWNRYGYGGPCPPSGTHRYFFTLYALDTTLPKNISTLNEMKKAMKGHILATAQLMGKYKRTR